MEGFKIRLGGTLAGLTDGLDVVGEGQRRKKDDYVLWAQATQLMVMLLIK